MALREQNHVRHAPFFLYLLLGKEPKKEQVVRAEPLFEEREERVFVRVKSSVPRGLPNARRRRSQQDPHCVQCGGRKDFRLPEALFGGLIIVLSLNKVH